MKKFYETPAVEFTGFNVEDVITVSIISTYGMDDQQTADFQARVTSNATTTGVNQAVSYNSYTW